jgi:hypothetical protein
LIYGVFGRDFMIEKEGDDATCADTSNPCSTFSKAFQIRVFFVLLMLFVNFFLHLRSEETNNFIFGSGTFTEFSRHDLNYETITLAGTADTTFYGSAQFDSYIFYCYHGSVTISNMNIVYGGENIFFRTSSPANESVFNLKNCTIQKADTAMYFAYMYWGGLSEWDSMSVSFSFSFFLSFFLSFFCFSHFPSFFF